MRTVYRSVAGTGRSCAVAFLVLLTAAAGAGVVAADAWAFVADWLGGFFLASSKSRLVGFGESHPAAALSAALDQLLFDRRCYFTWKLNR